MKLSVLYNEPVISENLYDRLEDMLKTGIRRFRGAIPTVGKEAKRRKAQREAEKDAREMLDYACKQVTQNLGQLGLEPWQVAKIAKYLNSYKDQKHLVDQVMASRNPSEAASDPAPGAPIALSSSTVFG